MPALPPQLSTQVFANLFDVYSLLCCEISEDGRIDNIWGNSGYFGLHALKRGTQIQDVPFLMGMPIDEEWVLKDAQTFEERHCNIHYTPDINGQNFLVFVPTQWTIQRRREEQQRSHELEVLQQRNAKLIEELQQAKGALQNESALKSKFIAGMSHEFRTPLTSIIGYTQLMSEQLGLSMDTQEHLAAVERSSQHLLSLVENLLDQAQFESNKFELVLSNVSIEELMEEIASIIAPLAADKGLAFRADLSPRCQRFAHLDGTRVRQVFINILGNAVKFTDEGAVTFSIDQEGDELICVIEDTGPGIPDHARETIFSAFQRVKETSLKPGVGLGLNISARLVERMKGTIEVDSELGEGTKFTIRIPYESADQDFIFKETNKIKLPLDSDPNRTKHLLLAEDNPDISQLLKLLLKRSGYDITLATNGKEAIEKMSETQFDAVITDLLMPTMTGQELVAKLREKGYENPVIALTASHKKNEIEALTGLGFSVILNKPVQMPELLSTLDKLLE